MDELLEALGVDAYAMGMVVAGEIEDATRPGCVKGLCVCPRRASSRYSGPLASPLDAPDFFP